MLAFQPVDGSLIAAAISLPYASPSDAVKSKLISIGPFGFGRALVKSSTKMSRLIFESVRGAYLASTVSISLCTVATCAFAAPAITRELFAATSASLAVAEAASAFPMASPEALLARAAALAAASAESFAAPACLIVSARTCSSWARRAVSLIETSPSKTPSPTTPIITSSNPIAAAGMRQPGGATSLSFLSRHHSFRPDHVSPISSTHPIATTPLEINRHTNQNSSLLSSEDRTESTTGADLASRKQKDMRAPFIFLAFTGMIAICEVLYISFRPKA